MKIFPPLKLVHVWSASHWGRLAQARCRI